MGTANDDLLCKAYDAGERSFRGWDLREADLHEMVLEDIDLGGADLRGAKLDNVDFYLVDLRGARFDAAAAEHLTRCRAILVDRCA